MDESIFVENVWKLDWKHHSWLFILFSKVDQKFCNWAKKMPALAGSFILFTRGKDFISQQIFTKELPKTWLSSLVLFARRRKAVPCPWESPNVSMRKVLWMVQDLSEGPRKRWNFAWDWYISAVCIIERRCSQTFSVPRRGDVVSRLRVLPTDPTISSTDTLADFGENIRTIHDFSCLKNCGKILISPIQT